VRELVAGRSGGVGLGVDGGLGQREVRELGVLLCDALSDAHAQGVIRRDIKPANLMRTQDGRLKVLDFGIALMRKARGELAAAMSTTERGLEERLGHEARAAGTPAYMAPEQRMGLLQDARVDVWATGVTLYELLVGRRPYSSVEVVDREFEVSWPQGARVLPELRQVIDGCLDVRPVRRTESMQALRTQLQQALQLLSAPELEVPQRRTNMSDPGDAFVGRADELARLHERVFVEGSRLVSVVGPGGVGKTRLATEFGLGALERGDVSQALLCSLVEAQTRDGVLFALARALGMPPLSGDPVEQLRWVLEGSRGLLLVMDNCEQVLEPLAEVLGVILPSLDGVCVVTTSRTPLQLPAERVVHVVPLEEVEQAVELYTARARDARAGWSCPVGQEDALRELVEELDGLPLAIELAAARSKVLPPKKMLERLNQRFDILRTGKRGVSGRQATLRGTIAWSWELLDEAAKATMAQLSVFEGAFTLEAAEEVLDLMHLDDEPFVLDVMEHLVDTSLLRLGDDDLFSMLVSVRAFAAEKLGASGREEHTRRRHAVWFGRWGLDAVERECGSGARMLLAEVEDLDSASRWVLGGGHEESELLECGLSCTAALAAVLALTGPFDTISELSSRIEGALTTGGHQASRVLGRLGELARLDGDMASAVDLLERALEVASRSGDEVLESHWKGGLGVIAWEQGDSELARRSHEEAIELAHRAGDVAAEGRHLGNLANLEDVSGNSERARELFERALTLSRRAGDRRGEGVHQTNLGNLELMQRRMEEARGCFEGARGIALELGDRRMEVASLGNLGLIAWRLGTLDDAASLFQGALDISRRIGDRRALGRLVGRLGLLEEERGHHDEAQVRYEEARVMASRVGDRRMEGVWLGHLGLLSEAKGHPDAAKRQYEQALEIARELGESRNVCVWLGNLGTLEQRRERPSDAIGYFEKALEVAEEIDSPEEIVHACCMLGSCASAMGDRERAIRCLERAQEAMAHAQLDGDGEEAELVAQLAAALGMVS